MHINKKHYRTIWPDVQNRFVEIIDQTKLPFHFEVVQINSVIKMSRAIKSMQVRGAPLIGVSAAYGIALAMEEDGSDAYLKVAAEILIKARPTAVNLSWAVTRMVATLQKTELTRRKRVAWELAATIAEEDVQQNQAIGQYGLTAIKKHYQNKVLNIMTHCNAGWLATVDYGTALAPVYAAHDAGLNIHVWVGETRPRNQGASLTAWELAQHGIPHTVITDNAGGHLMQQGRVDLALVGADRVATNGDVCNKVGTYLKALAAGDNQIPFYVAVPSPTIDWTIQTGTEIEIENRSGDEVAYIQGQDAHQQLASLRIIPDKSRAENPAFDVTPARLVTGIITEKGVYSSAELEGLKFKINPESFSQKVR